MRKILSFITGGLGSITALFGVFGALGLCCLPLIAGILGFFGLSSFFLIKYNKLFLAFGFILVFISIVLIIKYKDNKECKSCKNGKRKNSKK